MEGTGGLQALVRALDGVATREEWHEWKRSHRDLLAQCLDYRQREGMPDVTQIVAPHFSGDLVGLNYTPAAGVSLHHHDGGWSPTLRLCRGITFDREGALVALPFPKFFNFGERLGDWGDGTPEVTEKLDGHLVICFKHDRKIVAKTRGDFESPTAILVRDAVRAELSSWEGMDLEGVTVLCEMIHPETRVGIDYGDRHALVLIGLYDNASGTDLPIHELRKAGDAFGLEVVNQRDLSREDLMAVINGGGNNMEGFVARWPDGHRVKFKYAQYMVEMGERRAAERQTSRPQLAGVGRRSVDRAVQRGPSYLMGTINDAAREGRRRPS